MRKSLDFENASHTHTYTHSWSMVYKRMKYNFLFMEIIRKIESKLKPIIRSEFEVKNESLIQKV
jgi:hypothetical protein